MTISARSSLTALAFALCAAAASAQDFQAAPRAAALSLEAASDPPPMTVAAGGGVNAFDFNPACRGFIANAPDIRLQYAGDNSPFVIVASSAEDTTLIIHTPDDAWYCDDNSAANGRDPVVRIDEPIAGAYAIWVGARAGNADATLTISR